MANDIKSKIVLEGEKQYSQALKDAQRNLRTLRTELKAETAELGANATAQQKNETKLKNLKAQIAEQEKIVKTYKEALEEVRQKYADNDDEIAKWEQRLNTARASLANMQNTMTGLSSGIAQVGATMQSSATEAAAGVVATKSFADALGKIADAGSSVSSTIEGLFTGVVDRVRETISEIWGQITELAGRANEWGDIAGYWNTDTSTIQKWYHATRSTYKDFETMSTAVAKIVTADQKKVAENAGVSAENYTDKWEYAMQVMKSLAGMDYESRLSAVEEIFGGGNRATKFMDLINGWKDIEEATKVFDAENGGIGMTEEQLQTMSDVAVQVATIQEKWSAFKDSFTAGLFGKLTLDLGSNVEGALDALNLFFKAETQEERDKALDDFKKQLTEFFRKLGEAIKEAAKALDEIGTELQGSEDGTLRTIGKIVSGLSDLLDWLGNPDSVGQIVAGLETLAGFWLVGKGVGMASKIASIVKNLDVIRNFKMPNFDNPTGPTGPTGPTDGGKPVTDSGGPGGSPVPIPKTGGGWLTGLMNGATKFAGNAASFFVQTGGMLPALGDRLLNETNAGRALRDGQNVLEGVNQDITEKAEEVKKNVAGYGDAWRIVWNNAVAFWNNVYYGNPYGPGGGQPQAPTAPAAPAAPAAPTTGAAPSVAGFNSSQRQAAETYWDAVRGYATNPGMDTETNLLNASTELSMALGNSTEMFDSLDALIDELQKDRPDDWTKVEDLPSGWWRSAENTFNKTDGSINGLNGTLAGLPDNIRAAVLAGASQIRVTLDGRTVGYMTAPYVNEALAQDINN